MLASDKIEHFAKQVLGCSCPHEMFDDVDYRLVVGNAGPLRKIIVGDRLLIYIVDFDRAPSAACLIKEALCEGVVERNERGLDRFRLVLLTADPDVSDDAWQAMVRALPQCDDRVHLHMIDVKDAADL